MGDALVRDEDGSPLIHFAPHLEGDRLRGFTGRPPSWPHPGAPPKRQLGYRPRRA
jgi:hypothetical protein